MPSNNIPKPNRRKRRSTIPAPDLKKLMVSLRRSMAPVTGLMGLASVVAGCMAALIHDHFHWTQAILCALFACLLQMASNVTGRYLGLLNHYAVSNDGDDEKWRETMLAVFREGGWALSCLACLVGLGIMNMAGWWSIVLASVIVILVWVDITPPFTLVRTPIGIIITFILFGPVCVVGTSLVQTGTGMVEVPWEAVQRSLVLSCAAGIMAVNAHLGFCYRTYLEDLRTRRHTFTVTFGRGVARWLFLFNGFAAYGVLWAAMYILELPSPFLLMIFPTLWLCWNVWLWWQYGHGTHERTLWLSRANLWGILCMWLGLSGMVWILIGSTRFMQL